MMMRWDVRRKTAVLLTLLTLAAGCMRRAATGQNFGLPGRSSPPQAAPKTGAETPEIGRPAAASPEGSLRTVIQQQTQGAFDPVVADRRIQELQSLLKLNPQDLPSRLKLAGIYEDYRLIDQALEQYTEVLQLTRAAPESNGPQADQAVLGLGRCARASGRSRQAISLLEAAIKDRPVAGAWDELGLLYDELEDLAAGEHAFREAVARDGKSGRLHNNLGYNLMLQNQLEAAESEFRLALELNPKSATAGNNLGVVLARRGELQGALEQFLKSADAAAAHNNLAVVLLETGKYEQSREELVKALAVRPYFAPALANLKLVQERICERAGTPGCGPRPAPDNHAGAARDAHDGKGGVPPSADRPPKKKKSAQS